MHVFMFNRYKKKKPMRHEVRLIPNKHSHTYFCLLHTTPAFILFFIPLHNTIYTTFKVTFLHNLTNLSIVGSSHLHEGIFLLDVMNL